MARRNRVTPFGEPIAADARGTLLGNRGVLHDAAGQPTRRRWTTLAWIACRLEFRGRRRALMQPGRWTELFFLDEATAFAAGHRPCGECRHGDFLRFARLWAAAVEPGPDGGRARAGAMDRRLQRERVGEGPARPLWRAAARDLPDGTFVLPEADDRAWLLWRDRLWRWNPWGYDGARSLDRESPLCVLTPPSFVAVFRAGYCPAVHPSAACPAARGGATLDTGRQDDGSGAR